MDKQIRLVIRINISEEEIQAIASDYGMPIKKVTKQWLESLFESQIETTISDYVSNFEYRKDRDK